jgi:transcriptional regulator with XRE-family HTH domain
MFLKQVEREAARRLRREEGLAIRVIAARLGVAVSSVSLWTRDIELTEAQHERLRQANPIYNQQLRGHAGRSASARAVRLAAQDHGRSVARQGNPEHLMGCMLHWAEGSKDRNRIVFTNSDPEMLRAFLRFLRGPCYVSDERISLSINCHLNNGLSLAEIERWWLAELGLPASALRTATVNRPSSASRWGRNVLVYGTARLCVHSTFLVQSIYGAIQEYLGFDRPRWVD